MTSYPDGGFVDPDLLALEDAWHADDVYVAPPPFVRPDVLMAHQYVPAGYRASGYAPAAYAAPGYGRADVSGWSSGPGYASTTRPDDRPRMPRRHKVIAFTCAGLAVVVAALALVAHAHRTHNLTLPATFSDYTRLTNGTAKQLEKQARDRLRVQSPTTADALILGVYARNGSDEPIVFFDGFAASDNDQIAAQLQNNEPKDVVDEALTSAGATDSKDYPTGPFGGSLRCGSTSDGIDELPVCAWADSRSTAVLVLRDGSDVDAAAAATLALRNAAEH